MFKFLTADRLWSGQWSFEPVMAHEAFITTNSLDQKVDFVDFLEKC